MLVTGSQSLTPLTPHKGSIVGKAGKEGLRWREEGVSYPGRGVGDRVYGRQELTPSDTRNETSFR